MKTKKKLVAEDLSALLLPVSMRKGHRIHLHAQYKADFYVYILQNLSVALGQIILSLVSCYIYEWLKRKKPTDFEITEIYLRKCHKEVVSYEKSVVTARRKYLAQSDRYPKSYEKELRAYEGALLTVKDPEQLTKSLAAAVKRRKRNNIKKIPTNGSSVPATRCRVR